MTESYEQIQHARLRLRGKYKQVLEEVRDLQAQLATEKERVEVLEERFIRVAPFLEYLAKYDSKAVKWAKDKKPFEWLTKLQDEVDEVRGVLGGTHDDSLLHELLQIATIAFHWGELVIADARAAKAALETEGSQG